MVVAVHLYRRMMRRGRVIALIALSSVPGLVYWLASFDADPSEQESFYSGIVSTAGFSFAIAALILTAATLREERDAGTLPYLYMRPIARHSLALSALGAGTAAALTVALGGWLATLLAVLAVGTDVTIAASGLVLFVSAAVGYSAVFVPLGYLVPRSLLVGLGYIVVVESIVASAVSGFAQLSIWRIAVSIYADVATVFGEEAMELLGPVAPGLWGGVLKLGSVLVVGFAVLTWALRRRDAL